LSLLLGVLLLQPLLCDGDLLTCLDVILCDLDRMWIFGGMLVSQALDLFLLLYSCLCYHLCSSNTPF